MKTRAVNITQIAKLANVHPSTVSRALNGSPLVKQETREWIEQIAKENGYIPDAVAKSLSMGQTLTLGVIVPEISNPFYAHIVDEIETTVGKKGYSVIIAGAGFDPGLEHKAIRTMIGKRVDALVMCAPSPETEQELLSVSRRLPVVLCDTCREESQIDNVYVDERAGIKQAVQYLKRQGYQKVGFLADAVTKRRVDIFLEAMRDCDMPVEERYLYRGTETAVLSGYHGLRSMAEQHHLPDAVCTARDNVAIGAMRAAIEMGIDIPNQLGLIGYDDISVANFLYRKLSTIQQPADEIGRNISTILMSKLARDNESTSVISVRLIPKLVVRESTRSFVDLHK